MWKWILKILRRPSAEELAQRVVDAIRNTPKEYLKVMLNMRSLYHPENTGSVIAAHPHEILDLLMGAQWVRYDHPAIMALAVGFRAEIPKSPNTEIPVA